ncbi:MAG TPA: methyltransferase, partial [Candidatus Polarisedimenticolia bacterium]|nr:methyltransferase [Candidatus Polarisedimenticolia bacterium]
ASRLQADGKVLIVEMIIPDDNSPSMASMMDMNMLVMLPGRERSLSEYRSLLDGAGLRLEKVIQTHSPFQVIEASRQNG